MLDGCTGFKAFRKVTLPLSLPGLISVGVFSFDNAWNEFLLALILTSPKRNKTLPLGLSTWTARIVSTLGDAPCWLRAADGLFDPLCILTQGKLTSRLAEGGMKR